MKRLFWAVFLLPLIALSQPQAPDTAWTHLYAHGNIGEAHGIAETPDGGFLVAARSDHGQEWTDEDIGLIRINAMGDTIWTKTFVTDHPDQILCMKKGTGDLFYAAAYDFGISAGIYAFDSDGDSIWTRWSGDYQGLYYYSSQCMQITDSGQAVLAGSLWHTCQENGTHYQTPHCLQKDTNGNNVWSWDFSASGFEFLSPTAVLDGGCMVIGKPVGIGYQDIYARKFDTTGTTQWIQWLGCTWNGSALAVNTISGIQLSDGDFATVYLDSGFCHLTRLSPDGHVQWRRTISNWSEGDAIAADLFPIGENCMLIIGPGRSSDSTANEVEYLRMVCLDGSGNIAWNRSWRMPYNHFSYAASTITSDGGIMVAGSCQRSLYTVWDIITIKTTPFLPVSADPPEPMPEIAADPTLQPCYPNPFNPSTQIAFDLPKTMTVSLKVFDVLGRDVADLFEGRAEAGKHSFNFNGSALPSGVYLAKLSSAGFGATQKMVLLK
jgi:hypothetical protein